MRLAALLTGSVMIALAGCGGESGSGSDAAPFPSTPAVSGPATPEPGEPEPAEPADGLQLQLDWSPGQVTRDQEIVWRLTVTNSGDERVVLAFSSGQDGDVALLRDGREVHRWSRERVFTQVFREEPLEAGESKVYELRDRLAVEPGEYQVQAALASEPAPPPAVASLTVGS